MATETRLLFVCLGNICRSPAAEAVFLNLLEKDQLQDRFLVDSAGIGGWHVGRAADPRMRAAAERRGIQLASRARQLEPADPLVHYLRVMKADEVPDPYGGGPAGFEHVLDLLEDACRGLLEALR